MADKFQQQVFRFAPSPNGELHLGHAYSALLNFAMAQRAGGQMLLRIEDIDTARCTKLLEELMCEDLHWLGIEWKEEPRRQSQHFDDYQKALDELRTRGLIYPAFLSRGARKRYIAENSTPENPWPLDPDGAPLHPNIDLMRSEDERQALIKAGEPYAWRLDMNAALKEIDAALDFEETGAGPDGETGRIMCDPSRWGDVVLGRKETPTSYHLSVVIDDAVQNVTHVVRGRDLFFATSLHRLLQELFGLAAPIYHHHDLILADDGRKLSKSAADTSLRALRQKGCALHDIRCMVGFAATNRPKRQQKVKLQFKTV